MKKVIASLIQLQGVDTRLDELKLQKGDLPTLIEQAEEDLTAKQELLKELNEKRDKMESDRKMFEMEVEASRIQLKKYEEQLYQVKTNKEYDAISLEIDTKKLEIEGLDNKIIELMENQEAIEKEIEAVKKEIKDIEKQLGEYRNELEEISQLTKAEEERLQQEREAIVAEIEPRLYAQYERIRKAKGGVAVAPVRRNACGGCFSQIPPQKIVEIRELNRIITCEYCGRILVWDESQGQ